MPPHPQPPTLSHRSMQTETLSIAYFGKVPVHGDFVRRNATGAAVRALDDWLRTGLYGTGNGVDQALDKAREIGVAYPFYFAPREAEQVLVGVMGPSRDSIGRHYPFLVAFEAGAYDTQRAVQVPVQYNAFFEQAAVLVREAAAGHIERHDLDARIDALDVLPGMGPSSASFGSYVQQERLVAFWKRLWDHPQDSRKYLLFKNLIDVLLPLRDGVPPSFPLVLRFPLSRDGRTADYDVSFWLDVCLRLLGARAVQFSFFWTLSPPGMARPFVLIVLRPPPPRMLAYVLDADGDGDTLCALEDMGANNAALAALAIPPHYGRLLEDDRITLWDFLRRL